MGKFPENHRQLQNWESGRFEKASNSSRLSTWHHDYRIFNSSNADEQRYRVQLGDTLWIISQKHNLTIQNIMDYNNLSSSTIYIGQKLH